MKKIVLATGNKNKVSEMANLFKQANIEILSQKELKITSVAETGTTFIENAIIKARHAAKESGLPAIADDSGLAIDFLKGQPGIYSARFANQENASDQANIKKVLELMKDVPKEQRSARFHCVLVYMKDANDPTPIVCHGVWEGEILMQAEGSNGFGYDPIFYLKDKKCSAAQLASEVKREISHRGQALQKLLFSLK